MNYQLCTKLVNECKFCFKSLCEMTTISARTYKMFVTVHDKLEIMHKTCESTRALLQKFSLNDFKQTQLLRSAQTYKMFVTVHDE